MGSIDANEYGHNLSTEFGFTIETFLTQQITSLG